MYVAWCVGILIIPTVVKYDRRYRKLFVPFLIMIWYCSDKSKNQNTSASLTYSYSYCKISVYPSILTRPHAPCSLAVETEINHLNCASWFGSDTYHKYTGNVNSCENTQAKSRMNYLEHFNVSHLPWDLFCLLLRVAGYSSFIWTSWLLVMYSRWYFNAPLLHSVSSFKNIWLTTTFTFRRAFR